MSNVPGQSSRKAGIALVAVLAFLAILIVLAVTFMTSMRTERMASESQKDDARTEQFLKGCIAGAMDRINDRLIDYVDNNSATPPEPLSVPRPVNIHPPKSMAVLESMASNVAFKVPATLNLLGGEVQEWIPYRFLSSGDPDLDASNIAQNAQWIQVRDPTNPVTGNVFGRYAYVALDCTGLIDANYAHGIVHSNGVWVDEVNLDRLPEVGANNGDKLVQNRAKYTRFATLPEIIELNNGQAQGYPFTEASAIPASPPIATDLMPYSLCYDDGWYDWSTVGAPKWRAPGEWEDASVSQYNVTQWAEGDAQQVFGKLSYANAAEMSRCFADYTDADNVPGGSSSPDANMASCEAIPMINEIIATNELLLSLGPNPGESNLVHNLTIKVETWFPYVGSTNSQSYRVDLVGMTVATAPVELQPVINLPQSGPNFVPDVNNPFRVFYFPFTVTYVMGPGTNMPGSPPSFRVAPIYEFDVRIVEVATGNIVDQFKAPASDLSYDIKLVILPYPGGAYPKRGQSGLSVNDPRMNHKPTSWTKATPTESAMNSLPGVFNLSANGMLEGTEMYCANAPMKSVGELGFIHTGTDWTTIDLFSGQGRKLLTRFRDRAWTTRTYTNGFINPNTLSTNVLVAAFAGTPLMKFPDTTNVFSVLTTSEAGSLARDVVDQVTNVAQISSNSYDSGAGWVTAPAFQLGGVLTTFNNNKKEALIRNNYRLFNANQNLFTLIVVAQTLNDQGVVTGEKRGVALVWRDPFPNGAGQYEMAVRQFRYLDD